jgi:protein-S-isoprenylcysteine O-methyltransferase Ste14
MNSDMILIVFFLIVGMERLYERSFSNQALRGERKRGWTYATLHGTYIAVFLLSLVERFWWRNPVQWQVSAAGMALVAGAMLLRLTAIRTLGQFWSLQVEIRQQHQLVREGVYRYLRHPAYASMTLEIIALPLAANSYYTLAFAVAVFVPLLVIRLRLEERALVEKFGEEYVNFRREVGALFPRADAWRKWMCRSHVVS